MARVQAILLLIIIIIINFFLIIIIINFNMTVGATKAWVGLYVHR